MVQGAQMFTEIPPTAWNSKIQKGWAPEDKELINSVIITYTISMCLPTSEVWFQCAAGQFYTHQKVTYLDTDITRVMMLWA